MSCEYEITYKYIKIYSLQEIARTEKKVELDIMEGELKKKLK